MKSQLLVPLFCPALGCLPHPSRNEVLKHSSELASVRSVKAPCGSAEERGSIWCLIPSWDYMNIQGLWARSWSGHQRADDPQDHKRPYRVISPMPNRKEPSLNLIVQWCNQMQCKYREVSYTQLLIFFLNNSKLSKFTSINHKIPEA